MNASASRKFTALVNVLKRIGQVTKMNVRRLRGEADHNDQIPDCRYVARGNEMCEIKNQKCYVLMNLI